jgi:hypothetical protein
MENYQNRTQLGTLNLEVLIGNAPVRDLLDIKYKEGKTQKLQRQDKRASLENLKEKHYTELILAKPNRIAASPDCQCCNSFGLFFLTFFCNGLSATGKGNCKGLSLYLFGKVVRKQMSCSF